MIRQAILCLDDEVIIVEALRQELKEKFGGLFRYETALSSIEAEELLGELSSEGVRVILIISDWLMPGMKGDEFLALVKERHPEIRAIMITGHADAAAIARVLGGGLADCVLHKPWNSAELTGAVERCLRGIGGEVD